MKMTYIARLANTEVGFWCLGRKNDPLYVEDINIIGQEANITLNKFDDDALADYMGSMHSQGYDLDQFALIWGHTHPKGCGPSPSTTDETTFNSQTQFGGKAKLVMFIVSQSGGMYARLRITDPLLGRVETEMHIEIDFDTKSVDDFATRASTLSDMSGEWAKALELVAPLKVVPIKSTWNYGKGNKQIKSILPPAPTNTSTSNSFGKDPAEIDDADYDDDWGYDNKSDTFRHSTRQNSDMAFYDKQEDWLASRDEPVGIVESAPEEDVYDMDNFYTLISLADNNKNEDISLLMDDAECNTKFGCDIQDLEDIYLEIAAEIGELGSCTLLALCAEKKVSLTPWVGSTQYILREIMEALGITNEHSFDAHTDTTMLDEENFAVYLEANGYNEVAEDIRLECDWID